MSFADFLASKFALDQRSLNPAVRDALLQGLQGFATRDCLDVGAGTGATVARLLQWRVALPWRLTLLERDPELIGIARARTLRLLADGGHQPIARGDRIEGGDGCVAVHFAACDIDRHCPAARYDAVIAHAVMDLLPLQPTLTRCAQWLRPGGFMYAAIDYDGETVFEPPYRDAGFESDLLANYNETMEQRRVQGQPTGGALCGRRLQALLPASGFEIVCEGRSDWHVRSVRGEYRDRDEACLAVVIGLVAKEGRDGGRFDPERLTRWHEDRLQCMSARQLQLQVRNCDVLARRVGDGGSL